MTCFQLLDTSLFCTRSSTTLFQFSHCDAWSNLRVPRKGDDRKFKGKVMLWRENLPTGNEAILLVGDGEMLLIDDDLVLLVGDGVLLLIGDAEMSLLDDSDVPFVGSGKLFISGEW
jgi:hypothetical protein